MVNSYCVNSDTAENIHVLGLTIRSHSMLACNLYAHLGIPLGVTSTTPKPATSALDTLAAIQLANSTQLPR